MRKLPRLVLFILLSACNQKNTNNDKTLLDFGAFTIETPSSWKKVNLQGLDSYAGEIAIDERDTLNFDLGWYSNTLHENDVMFFDSSQFVDLDSSYKNNSEVVFIKHGLHRDADRYKKTDFRWDTINGRQAKIVFPRKPGTGITGIYIDSLWVSGSNVDRFNLYGKDLKPKNGNQFLEALKTLKFYIKH